jgi:uncharacterized membrane protein HdeD (DUF308 family)
MDLAAGVLGKFFGSNPHTESYIAGLVIILLVIFGAVYSCCYAFCSTSRTDMSAKEVWGIIAPIITGALGFIFGRSDKSPPKRR